MEAFTQQFETMYKAHYSLLRNTAENIVDDADASHDIVQEVFLKLWDKKEHPSHILNQRAYLMRSVINASISYLGKAKKKVRFVDIKAPAAENSDSALDLKELEVNVKSALDRLPAKCKAIFVLSRFDGIRNKEIADMMGLSLKTVENQIGIALKKMREELKPLLGSEFISAALGAGMSVLLQLLSVPVVLVLSVFIFSS